MAVLPESYTRPAADSFMVMLASSVKDRTEMGLLTSQKKLLYATEKNSATYQDLYYYIQNQRQCKYRIFFTYGL